MDFEIYENTFGEEMVKVNNENGTFTCMTKSQYDDLEAAKQQSGTL